MLRALVLDFDGLVVDTETTALESWQELYRQLGAELPLNAWAGTIGTWEAPWNPVEDLTARVGRPPTPAELAKRRGRELALSLRQPLLPGVWELLCAARDSDLELGIASSSSRAWVARHLESRAIAGRFRCLATRDDVERTKPDPALYRVALACLGVPAEEALAYEDSVLGVRAAKAAGLRVVAVPGPLTRDHDFREADLVLGSLAELAPAETWRAAGF